MADRQFEFDNLFVDNPEGNNYKEINRVDKKKMILLIIFSLLFIAVLVILVYFVVFYNGGDSPTPPTPHAEPLIINATQEHKYTFFFIPGLNTTPESVVDIFTKYIKLPYHNNTKLIIMRSNNNSVTVFDRKVMPSWFDIYKLPVNSSDNFNFTDLKQSANYITNKIKEEAKLLNNNYSNIYLMGTSQGAILTSHIAYSMKENLKFYVPLSGFLPEQTEILPNKENAKLFVAFGLRDEVILPIFHNKTMKRIANYQGVEKHYYPNLTHAVDVQELTDMVDYIYRRFEDDNHAKPLVLNPKEEHKYTFFFIPGLAMTPENVEHLFKDNAFLFPYYNNTKIVLLRSNNNSVTAFGGNVYPSWFDIFKFKINSSEYINFTDLKESATYIRNRIREEAYLLNNNFSRIYLMGFSQGAILTSHIIYTMPENIMFSIALSGFLPEQTEILPNKENTKLFVGFGLKDEAILPTFHNRTMKRVAKFQGIEKHYYPDLNHSIHRQQVLDVADYISRRFEDESHAKPKIILPTEEHKYSFFFIPGLNTKPEDVEMIFTQKIIKIPHYNNTKIILMRSNNNPVTALEGKVYPSWFDIFKFPVNNSEDYNFEDLEKSGTYIMNRIREEAYLLNNNYSLIHIMGFSQGAALTAHIAYTIKENLKFSIALSGFLPDKTTISQSKETTQFFSGFGLKDEVILPIYHNQTMSRIANFSGLEQKFFIGLNHTINAEVIEKVNDYLEKHFKGE